MTTTSRTIGLVSVLVGGLGLQAVACGDAEETAGDPYEICQGSDRDFVGRAMLTINGRRPWGEAETAVYVAAMEQARATRGEVAAREAIVRAMTEESGYRRRWGDFFMDTLRVSRSRFLRDDKYSPVQSQSCYGKEGTTGSLESAGPELAAYVRDHPPSDSSPPVPGFSLNALTGSAIALDDLTPLYRAQLLHRMSFPIPGANVPPEELERQRRHAFGVSFEDIYLNRNLTCLGCHNSDWSETPDRTHALPYRAEAAVFDGPGAPLDDIRYRSVFRYDGVANIEPGDPGARAPWGWDEDFCGVLELTASLDPLNIDTSFASVASSADDPNLGKLASVWLLEGSLHRGFEGLRDGIEVDDTGSMTDPDEAFAYLVSASIVESVWEEVIGTPLSVAHHFARNPDQRDTLAELTEGFIGSGFSLRELLIDITANPVFNLAPASSACWEEPYALPPIMAPFTPDVDDPSNRGNGPGERLHFLSTRMLLSALHQALERPRPEGFPKDAEEEVWQQSVGLTLSQSVPGFRGLDFQARLAWESRFGRCGEPGDADFITALTERAEADQATVEEVVVALKDRLIGEPYVTPEERGPTEALLGRSLSSDDLADLQPRLRLLCGALVVSPQFALGGTGTGEAVHPVPALTPADRDVVAICNALRPRLGEQGLVLASCLPDGAGDGG